MLTKGIHIVILLAPMAHIIGRKARAPKAYFHQIVSVTAQNLSEPGLLGFRGIAPEGLRAARSESLSTLRRIGSSWSVWWAWWLP